VLPRSFELDRLLEQYWDLYGPLVRTLGASGLAGMATAATLKVWKGPGEVRDMWVMSCNIQEVGAAAHVSEVMLMDSHGNVCVAVCSPCLLLLCCYLLPPAAAAAAACCCCCCWPLQWLGRTVLASLGLLFISLQVLNYYKVITIHWDVFDRSTSWFQQQMDHGWVQAPGCGHLLSFCNGARWYRTQHLPCCSCTCACSVVLRLVHAPALVLSACEHAVAMMVPA
jgi:hypothetical protein